MLYQKGTQRIEVIVRKEGGGVQGAKTVEPDEVENPTDTDTGTTTGRISNRFLRVNITHGFATARQVGLLGANYVIQGIGNYTGDQSYQQLVEREVEIFQDVTGFASSVAMGATYGGAGGGAPGAVLGALFAAVGTGASLGVKYASREREFNYKVFKENNAIEYQRARASISLTAGRLR